MFGEKMYRLSDQNSIRLKIGSPILCVAVPTSAVFNPELGNLSKTSSEILEGRWEPSATAVYLGDVVIVRTELSRLRTCMCSRPNSL